MSLRFENLDEITRKFMHEEIELDIANGRIYLSNRLTESGRELWPTLLEGAADEHDDSWLANQIREKIS